MQVVFADQRVRLLRESPQLQISNSASTAELIDEKLRVSPNLNLAARFHVLQHADKGEELRLVIGEAIFYLAVVRSRKLSGGEAVDDPPRSGSVDRIGLRADDRKGRAVSVWEANRELSGTGAVGGLERQPTSTGAYHQTRELSIALPAGGSSPQVTVRSVPEWRSKYFHLAMRRGRKIAKVAMARRLAIRLFWMWRQGWDYEQVKQFGSHAGQPGHRDGVQSNTE